MSHSILLAFEKTNSPDPQTAKTWHALANKLRDLCKNNKEIQMLGENCLLIPIDKGLDIFYQILDPYFSMRVPYKYAIFCQEIEWLVPKRSFSQDENNI